jgi:hypothetical protein
MKVCKYHPDKLCYRSSCDLIDDMGNVSVCFLHPNPDGFFMRKKLSGSSRSFHVFNKHLKGGS